ncbi:MAG: IS3 family transposase, partial [Clostridia bacterium]|nr:IS3 family transposase [Clostridia bacterium]
MKPGLKYKIIYRYREKYSISEMCHFFGVSRSGYYGYVKRMEQPAKDLALAEKIRECQTECRSTYGYRRVHIWLERQGIHHNPKTVLRVM